MGIAALLATSAKQVLSGAVRGPPASPNETLDLVSHQKELAYVADHDELSAALKHRALEPHLDV